MTMITLHIRKLLLLILAIIFTITGITQTENKKPIALVARSYADHIVLRYFATTPALFNTANKLGYIIEKSVVVNNTAIEKLRYLPLKASPFVRWNEAKWEAGYKNAAFTDSNELKLAGLAMAFSDSAASAMKGDVLSDDLKSLKEQRDNASMKFGFTLIAANRSKLAAEGLALRISDFDVVAGTTYVYRIRVNQPIKTNLDDWVYVQVQCKNFNAAYLRNDTTIKVIEADKSISFTFPESTEYYAFNVQRSDNNGITYKKLTDMPSIKLQPVGYINKTDYGFVDAGLINNKKYHYRVTVSTLFADELILSEFSAMPTDQTPPPAPFLKSADHIKPKEIELTWEMIEKDAGDLKGFTISRSSNEKTGYQKITKDLLPTLTRKYVDKNFDPDGSIYYVVEAIDTAGNISRSFPAYVTLIDSTAPHAPIITSAIIDSLGKITITIQPNEEKDFMGYQLLKANQADHEFSVIEETFNDSIYSPKYILYDSTTLNTLTKNIYYKLYAFDTHYNQSGPSKIIELKRRDTIPPIAPIITDYKVSDSSINIKFVNSSSDDVTYNILLKRIMGKEKCDTIFRNNNSNITTYQDNNIFSNNQYVYAMIAKDESGMYSKLSNSIILKTILNNRIPAPVINGLYDKATEKVTLKITIDEKLIGKKIMVDIYYRVDENEDWKLLITAPFEKGKQFIHEPGKGQKKIRYAAKLGDENNKVSNFSKEEIIIY
ncbi:MAG: hypothetical protein Q8R50_05835 [Sediminibacterium sp.]|nr:hypothetical protein [Sediminibacterium sp.]